MRDFSKYIFFLFFLTFSSGCQLNDTLVKIKENLILGDKRQESKEKIKKKRTPGTLDKNNQINEDIIAFVQPKITKKKIDKIKEKERISKIGLLLPITGENSKLGISLINSVRLYLEKEGELEFKTFDTSSTLKGNIDALEKGISEGIKIFIGPIFSDETSYIRDIAAKNKVLIFSFSTDKKVISKNIIITGINLEDEIACIISESRMRKLKNIGVITNNDPYGNLIIKTLEKLKTQDSELEISHLKIDRSSILDDEIKRFSFFEEGKQKLKLEIKRIESQQFDEESKNYQINELNKRETFGDKPYDVLIVGEGGSKLIEILALLAFYDIDSSNTNIFGTSIWEGIERFKENILDDTFYASSLENDKEDYNRRFESIFYKKPNNLNYILNDLLVFIDKKFQLFPATIDLSEIFKGEFSSYKVNEEGYLQRNIFINRIKKDKVESFYSCPVSLI